MVGKINRTLLPLKHLAILDEQISKSSLSWSRSPLGLSC